MAHLLLSIGGVAVVLTLNIIAYVAVQALPFLRRLTQDVAAVRRLLDEAAKDATPRR